jgi:hypothetical protein
MKTTETQQKVFDFIEKFSGVDATAVASGTQLNKLLVYKTVKVLAEKKLIKISDSKPPTYKLNKADEKNTKAQGKNNSKTEPAKKTVDDEVVLKSAGRDTTKLKFNGELYGKGKLCLAIAKAYLAANPRTSITKLREIFPDELNKRYGFFQTVEKAKKMSADRERFFLKPEDLIKVGDKKVAICNQFGSSNLPLKHFKSLGFVIK